MSKKMLIDATHPEETRVVVSDGNKVDEFDFESEARRQLAGNIYLAKVTRVEPSLQAAFVDYGGNRHGFLAFSEIHPDYYQIPVADREALMAEEAALAAASDEEDEKPKARRRTRSKAKSVDTSGDAVATADPAAADTPEAQSGNDIPGMDVVDLGADGTAADEARTVDTPEGATMPPAAASDDDTRDDGSDDADTNGTDASDDDGRDDDQNGNGDDDDGPYVAMNDAAERDSDIESVADEDVSDEIRRPRKSKLRKYKIQEVIKVRQILLVQVVKEERGNKGAALTTYLSLAGRYCVLMPNTARGGGISRKITNAADRKKLKEIAGSIEAPKGAGLIIRTAGSQRTKTEIKRDYEYLQRMWERIRELTLKSIAPAKIYEEGNLIKRSIRDLYNREIDEVLVEGAEGYRVAKDFMKMIMPSHAKNVKNYVDPMPLFARHQVESYLTSMFNPTVQLKSGGYIVIGVTEALVAIDVNSGKATKKGSIEETALETNLEAAEEIARQLRLRDLAGLIVIDFIDMEERRHNTAVEKKFKDKLKTDRARIQVGRISGFGLLEMSRQRLRPGMLEATTQPCSACHGTGLIRSDDNLSLGILRQIEEEGMRKRSREVLIKVPIGICNFLMNHKREHIAQIEARYGLSIRIEADSHLIAPDYTIEKFKTQTRVVEQTAPVISVNPSLLSEQDEIEPEIEVEDEAAETAEAPKTPDSDEDSPQPKKRRRRRRRKKSNGEGQGDSGENGDNGADVAAEAGDSADTEDTGSDGADDDGADDNGGKPRRRRSRGGRRRRGSNGDDATDQPTDGDAVAGAADAPAAAAAAPQAEERPVPETAQGEGAALAAPDAVVDDKAPEAPVADPAPAETAADAPAQPASGTPESSATETADLPGASQEPAPEERAPEASEPEATPEPAADSEAAKSEPEDEPARTEPEAETAAKPEPAAAPERDREPELATESAEAESAPKPKRRGWWSMGR